MVLPTDVLKTTVTFGKSYDAMGENATVEVKITPSHRLLWEATGDYISPFVAVSVADAGVVGTFQVARDQPGFRDGNGDEIRGWYYTAFVTETRGKESLAYRKVFTVAIDQALIDLDALPIDGIVQPPGAAPVPAVTSVNGQAGAVLVEGASSESVAAAITEDGPAKTALSGAIAGLFDIQIKSNGSADQTARIQAALDQAGAAGGGRVALLGSFGISAPLVVASDTQLDTLKARVTLIAGSNCNMLRLASGASLRSVTASITAGSAVLTAVAGSFTSADVGRSVVVPNAGPKQNNAELGTGYRDCAMTGIVTVVAGDGATATLSRPAVQAVNGASVSVHARTANIILDLGVWDRGTNTGVDNNLHSIFLRRGDNVRLRSIDYRGQFNGSGVGGKYGVSYGDMRDFTAGENGLRFESNSDGIHGIGPLLNTRIRNVTGITHDDACAVGISDYASYGEISGPIEDLVIENVTARADARAVLISANVRSDYTISGAVVRSVRGSTESPFVRITGSNDTAGDVSGHVGVLYVRLDDIQGRPRAASPLVSLNGAIGIVDATGLKRLNDGKLIAFDPLTKVRSIRVRGWDMTTGNTAHVMDPTSDVEIGEVVLDGANVSLSSTASIVYGEAKIDRISLRNHTQSGGRGIDLRRATSVCIIDLHNVESDVPIVRPSSGSTQMTVMTSGKVYYSGAAEGAIRMAGGAGSCTLHASEGFISASGRAISRSATQTLRGIGLAVRQPAGDFTPQAGDRHFNTDAAAAAGIGPVVYDSATAAYKSMGTTGSAGSVTPPATGQSGQPVNAEVLTDTFTRTTSEVVGTTPDAGGSAYVGATGRWQTSGTRLVKGSTLDTQACFVKAPAKGDMTASFVWRTGTTEAASVTERMFLKAIDANTGIRLQRTGQTGASMSLSVVVAGTARQLGSTVTNAIPGSTAPADYAVTITVSTSSGVTSVSAVVNGIAFAGGALTSDEVAALSDARAWGVGSNSPNTQIDDLHVTVSGAYV